MRRFPVANIFLEGINRVEFLQFVSGTLRERQVGVLGVKRGVQ